MICTACGEWDDTVSDREGYGPLCLLCLTLMLEERDADEETERIRETQPRREGR